VRSSEGRRGHSTYSATDSTAQINLERLELRGDPGALREAAIPWSSRAALAGRPLLRHLKKADLVLWRDVGSGRDELAPGPDEAALPVSLEGTSIDPRLLQVGYEVSFLIAAPPPPKSPPRPGVPVEIERVGPFRILSVGAVVNRRPGQDNGVYPDHRRPVPAGALWQTLQRAREEEVRGNRRRATGLYGRALLVIEERRSQGKALSPVEKKVRAFTRRRLSRAGGMTHEGLPSPSPPFLIQRQGGQRPRHAHSPARAVAPG
jgi:hypothetical protein